MHEQWNEYAKAFSASQAVEGVCLKEVNKKRRNRKERCCAELIGWSQRKLGVDLVYKKRNRGSDKGKRRLRHNHQGRQH
jgi:hypothetical protein